MPQQLEHELSKQPPTSRPGGSAQAVFERFHAGACGEGVVGWPRTSDRPCLFRRGSVRVRGRSRYTVHGTTRHENMYAVSGEIARVWLRSLSCPVYLNFLCLSRFLPTRLWLILLFLTWHRWLRPRAFAFGVELVTAVRFLCSIHYATRHTCTHRNHMARCVVANHMTAPFKCSSMVSIII